MKFKTIFFTLLFSLVITFSVQSQKFISAKGKDIIGVDSKPFLIKEQILVTGLYPKAICSNLKT